MKSLSIEDAKELLPELKNILKEIKQKGREYSKCLVDATQLILNFRNNPYDTEGVLDRTIKTRNELKQLFSRLESYGVVLRDIEKGIIDFPAEIDGDEVFLCWRSSEEDDIMWWHERDEPCEMRKPLKRK